MFLQAGRKDDYIIHIDQTSHTDMFPDNVVHYSLERSGAERHSDELVVPTIDTKGSECLSYGFRFGEIQKLNLALKNTDIGQVKLRLEKAILDEKFRIQEEELDDESNDGISLRSQQSSFSKVEQWQIEPQHTTGPVEKAVSPQAVQTTVIAPVTTVRNDVQPKGHTQVVNRSQLELSKGVTAADIPLGSNADTSFCGMINTISKPSSNQGLETEGSKHIPLNSDTHTLVRNDPQVAHSSHQFPFSSAYQAQSFDRVIGISSNAIGTLDGPKYSTVHANDPQVTHSVQQHPLDRRGLPGAVLQGVSSNQGNQIPSSYGFLTNSEPAATGQYGLPHYSTSSALPPGFGLGPTPQQLTARQVMSRELPPFSGNPEDWPLFISSYRNSTQVCGYSEAENLARLQRCLRGHALEIVRSRLLLPAGVPHVIATLEMMYGRPELLIHTLLQKVRSVPPPKHDRLDLLIAFGVAVQNLRDHLEAGGQHAHYNNLMLLSELVEKLPANLKLDWSLYKQRCGEVNIRIFSQYMSMLVRAATDVTLFDPRQHVAQQHRAVKPEKLGKDKSFCGSHTVEESSKQGPTYSCGSKSFIPTSVSSVKSVEERWKTIQQYGLCCQCLGAYGRRPCKSQRRCEVGGCQFRHHPLLHSIPLKSNPKESEAVVSYHKTEKRALFRIIPVTLYGNNRSVSVFAFLDDGSSTTLIDEGVVKELGVTGEQLPLCLQWTANVKRSEAESQRVRLEISGGNDLVKYPLADVRTVSSLDLPQQTLRYAELSKIFPHLKGLPVRDYTNAHPRILIGNNHAHVTATLKIREGRAGDPIAAKSRLGWTIFGSSLNAENAHSFLICECNRDQGLHEMVEQYFSVDNVGVAAASFPQSKEEQRATRILTETTKRVGMRFESGLLWKFDDFEFPDNYAMAMRRLHCLERRIRSDTVIGDSVKRQLAEYRIKGYLHEATKEELEEADPRKTWYLPLGVTIYPKKPSKIRIFCDTAAMVDGVSLNTMLIKGPDLLNSLLGVLFGFREKRIAIRADLMEMFHQIQIRKEDRHAQRILWRDDPNQEPKVYLMNVATFGATCSPSDAIIRKHYVEDYLDSADSVAEAVRLAQDVCYVHSRGGFHLRKWLSNSKDVLRRVGERNPDSEKCLLLDKASSTERVLGMYWRPEQDVFTYTYSVGLEETHPTKRQILRAVMSLFDPLGLLSHFLVFGKIIIQQIWRAKTGWDEPIPKELCERWTQWTAEFKYLDQISIPRCYFPQRSVKDISSLQLLIFVDAGEDAYACVAYLRAEFSEKIQCAIIGGKTKVAPLKTLSIPRLELMAAVIVIYIRTVLAWINANHCSYRQFVACRIGEMLSKSKVEEWRWVPSRENVADEALKWGRGPCLSTSGRWFTGPEYLLLPEEQWPADVKPFLETTTEEMKSCLVHQTMNGEVVIDWSRFSKWQRLWRTIGYVQRYVKNYMLKAKGSELQVGSLTQEELYNAEKCLWRQIQRESYPEEMKTLEAAQSKHPDKQAKLHGTSKLRKLSPFLDTDGVIRLDTRIVAATCVSYDTRCPIVLPKEHPATQLLIEWYHRKYLHANAETVVNEVRQRFHISNLRTIVRQIKKMCSLCRIRKAVPEIPRMAPLPAARLSAYERPFSYVGLDYFGPTLIRVNRSETKRWIALFTCLTIRAVHLEVVHSLSTESCKMALRRFINRRGAPIEIHSDRGTNFVGTNNELRREMSKIDDQLAEVFTNANTKWVFNPPGTPHMGGSWERLVRSVKTALAAMYTTRTPNEETLITLVIEAECVMNSRPLTFIPLEVEQQKALTPNQFLLLSSSGVVQPRQALAESKYACRSNWNLGRVMLDQFWRRWVREYLPTLTRRSKWFDDVKPIGIGDLVIVVEEGIRNGWTRGRVLEVIAGLDGRIRQAMVQTASGLVRRPVAKLARLDLKESKTGLENFDQSYGSGKCNSVSL
ncbi:uncharacterized protein LOC129774135 [Toxorhynchites rutilus septentrionalis]|uniref:uncharacterized protein LOC129774135 n=1 Tax=Toxorhynchites rutilus septentrionalis TaxID=329112 RepID=UPI0024796A21|nr:uncharacterized protein LOC129774135 [Toxorhynchites rutilus septentrionalis]